MTEWCMAHPWMTFIIISQGIFWFSMMVILKLASEATKKEKE